LQGSLLQIDIAQIIVDEGDEPNPLVDFLDTEARSGKDWRLGTSWNLGRYGWVEAM
jgi:hypothetical protein